MDEDPEAIADSIEKGPVGALLTAISPMPLDQAVRERADSPDLEARLFAVQALTDRLIKRGDFIGGRVLAEALMIAAERRLEQGAAGRSLVAEALGAAADLAATAAERLGEHARIVALADVIPGKIIADTNGYRAASLAMRKVDALIILGRIGEAKAALDDAERYQMLFTERSGIEDGNLNILRSRFSAFLSDVTAPAPRETTLDEFARDRDRDDTQRSVAALTQLASMGDPKAGALLAKLEGRLKAPADQRDARDVLQDIRREIAEIAAITGVSDALQQHKDIYDRETAILVDPVAGRDPKALTAARAVLRDTLRWFETHGQPIEAMDTLWPIVVMSCRLGEHEEALRSIERIQSEIERLRASISNPLERAGLYRRFPYLYDVSVNCALQLGRLPAALRAIEASKGRAIAELREVRNGLSSDAVPLAEVASASIEQLTAALSIDYLSFQVVVDEIRMILVTSKGDWHAHRLPISKENARALMSRVDPRSWRVGGFLTTPVAKELAGLVDWALPHLTAPILVFSPDDPLHNLPFHYLQIEKGWLVDRVIPVRVHGVRDLLDIAQRAVVRPTSALAVYVPAADEVCVEDRRQAFEGFCDALGRLIPPQRIPPEDFDLECAARIKARGRLVHLAAHGTFPRADARPEGAASALDDDPFKVSGLLLASGGALPRRDGTRQPSGLLSPKIVLDGQDLDAVDAVICIQACVSGLSREGAGGDALGLEWAFLARGAASVIASHWDVNFTPALAFFSAFYHAWLGDGLGRGEAYAKAMRLVRDRADLASYDMMWSAFTLTGDWR